MAFGALLNLSKEDLKLLFRAHKRWYIYSASIKVMFATPAKKKSSSWTPSVMDMRVEIPLLRSYPRGYFVTLVLKFFPWNEAAKVKPHLSDIIISSHVRSRTFYMCWSWFRTGWMRQERGSGVGGCRVLHSERDHRGCPTSFPIYSRANENTGKRHIPIS